MPKLTEKTVNVECSSRLILDQIADKWSILVIVGLCEQPMRFNAIRRALGGVTQKALTQTLRRLERNGIVTRLVIPVSPVAVEYRITPLGRSLKSIFTALRAWTLEHLSELERAQRAFDKRVSAKSARYEPMV
jgi:DNA-binding HxlR family transcriptional regulator